MSNQRPLPIPPVYPGIIPYRIDNDNKHQEDADQEDTSSPRLLGVEHRPVSVGSFGPPSTQTVPGLPRQSRDLSDEQVRDKFFAYWQKQKERNVWVPSDGLRYQAGGTRDHQESQSGSQATLLSPKLVKQRWPRGSDFLGASTSFTLSLHTLWMLPVSVMMHGGVTFLLMYTVMLIILGCPLLLLEITLGQYSSLSPGQLYRHICPLMSGLGLSVCLQAGVRGLLDLATLMWSALSFYKLFNAQHISESFFYSDILNRGDADLETIGSIGGQQALVLSVVSVGVFIMSVAGTRALGKIGLVSVPVCFMLMVTLVIRSCLAGGGPYGILTLMSPDWSHMTSPSSWMLAAGQVVFSLQLGLGAVTAFSSYNNYHHNIVRDCVIMITCNIVWVILSVLLVFSLLGVTHDLQTINLHNLKGKDVQGVSITGDGVLLTGVTLVETALASVTTGWLWAGLLFILIFITTMTSLFGFLEVISSSIISIKPSLLRYKPAITFSLLTFLFLLDLVLATQGGLHVYHLLMTYIGTWPAILTCLLTLLATLACHGAELLVKHVVDMSKVNLGHVFTCHLTVLYTSVSPVLLASCLATSLHLLASYHLRQPLVTFNIQLPVWAVSTGWSLSLLPVSPILFGAVVYLVWANKGVPRFVTIVSSLKCTERWHRAAIIELETGPGYSHGKSSTA